MSIIRFLKDWTLPVAIAVGTVSYLVFAYTPSLEKASSVMGDVFDVVFPFTVFSTLFVTFTKVDFRKMHPMRWQLWLIVGQVLIIGLVTGAILMVEDAPRQKIIGESVLTCVIAPCASAAAVVTGKLGGNLNSMTFFTLCSNLLCALTIPAIFPMLEKAADLSFITASLIILQRLALVLLLPLLLGWLVHHYVHSLYRAIVRRPNLGFYCWGISLAITTGITVKNICHSSADGMLLGGIAVLSLVVCVLQFVIGRGIGRMFGDPINAGQGMFQKNTSMAILMAYQYLNPVASIGAGCYVLWQNIINSYELWEFRRSKSKQP